MKICGLKILVPYKLVYNLWMCNVSVFEIRENNNWGGVILSIDLGFLCSKIPLPLGLFTLIANTDVYILQYFAIELWITYFLSMWCYFHFSCVKIRNKLGLC